VTAIEKTVRLEGGAKRQTFRHSVYPHAKNRYAIKTAEIVPIISAVSPHKTAYLVFLIPTDPK